MFLMNSLEFNWPNFVFVQIFTFFIHSFVIYLTFCSRIMTYPDTLDNESSQSLPIEVKMKLGDFS